MRMLVFFLYVPGWPARRLRTNGLHCDARKRRGPAISRRNRALGTLSSFTCPSGSREPYSLVFFRSAGGPVLWRVFLVS